jgi:predicted nucleic acid-binding protein
MNYTIDASVFVAAARTEEVHYPVSIEFLDQIQAHRVSVYCPTLVLAECAAAIARPTGDVTLAEQLAGLVESFPGLSLTSVTVPLARRAAKMQLLNDSAVLTRSIWP